MQQCASYAQKHTEFFCSTKHTQSYIMTTNQPLPQVPTFSVGPAIREVPVSAMATQPLEHRSLLDPICMPDMSNCQ